MPIDNLLKLDAKPMDGVFEMLAKRLQLKSTLDHILDRLEANAVDRADLKRALLKLKLAQSTADSLEKVLAERTKEWEAAVQQIEQKNGEIEALQQQIAKIDPRLRSYDSLLTQLYLAANSEDLVSKNLSRRRDAFDKLTEVLQHVARQRPVIVP